MRNYVERNRALLHFIVVPTLLLTVALLGGLRIDAQTRQFIFIAPPLVTLILAILLGLLFLRAGLIDMPRWLALDQPTLTNLAHLLTLISLLFASAQAFNSVLPESGLLHWMFSCFFLWTLWTNQFSIFDGRRLLRSVIVLFATAFLLKHLLVSGLYAPEGGLMRRIAAIFLQGIAVDVPAFAPATGYLSFFALALYVIALLLITPAPAPLDASTGSKLVVSEKALAESLQQPRSGDSV